MTAVRQLRPIDATLGAAPSGPSEYECSHSRAGEQDGHRESALGSASDPRRVGQAGRRGLGANRVPAPATTASSAVTDVAHLSDESRRRAGLDRFLYRINRHRPRPVRVRRAPAPSPTNRPFQRDGVLTAGRNATVPRSSAWISISPECGRRSWLGHRCSAPA
jgi:hypothetical protein